MTVDDERVDELAVTACQLVARVRTDQPAAVGAWLATQLPDPHDWWALVFVLAAAVPADVPWSHLTAWTRLGGWSGVDPDAVPPWMEREPADQLELDRWAA